MKKALQVKCECGWSIIAPMNDGDIVKHVQIHANESHQTNPSREEVLKTAKQIEI